MLPFLTLAFGSVRYLRDSLPLFCSPGPLPEGLVPNDLPMVSKLHVFGVFSMIEVSFGSILM
jgi:hypothetical protein